jgi:hypothetical protein
MPRALWPYYNERANHSSVVFEKSPFYSSMRLHGLRHAAFAKRPHQTKDDIRNAHAKTAGSRIKKNHVKSAHVLDVFYAPSNIQGEYDGQSHHVNVPRCGETESDYKSYGPSNTEDVSKIFRR